VPISNFADHDALALADLVRRREVSPRELVAESIARIERHNPALNAVVHPMFDAAVKAADGPLPQGPFTGVPFLLKDLLAWYEGEPITSGSRLYRGFRAPHDSEVVKRYRQAGVVVVGKTNTPELGITPFTESTFLGPARNPWNPAYTTGGSSGGSGAAVASGMVPMAAGGDGGGSLRIPASCCGVFGMKPTRGRVPWGPDQGELWRGAVVEGVISRSVRDSAAMLDAISGPDVGAPYWAEPPERPYAREVGAPPGKLRIAFTDSPMLGHTVHEDCKVALRDAVTLLESLGHECVEAAPPLEREPFNRAFLVMVCAEIKADLNDAAALIGRSVARDDVEFATWALSLLAGSVSAGEYASSMRVLQRAARRIGAFHEAYDVWLTPTLAMPPFIIGALQPPPGEARLLRALGALRAGGLLYRMGAVDQAADKVFDFIPYTPIANMTGQPAMSVPLSWNAAQLPIGVHFTAKFGDEATLFRLAAQLELARPWAGKRPPIFG